jgi:hypothetical protein
VISSLPQLSEKIQSFFSYVQSESGRSISLQQTASVGLQGMNFAFEDHPTNIIIRFVLPFKGSIDQFEQSLAHEAGHGLMTHGRDYIHLEPNQKLDNVTAFSLSVIGTMIDDVPVNKVIQDHGFRAYDENYVSTLKREAKAAKRKDFSIYSKTGPNDLTKKRFAIYRYVAAWAYLQYFTISSIQRDVLRKFRKNFKRAYPNLSKQGLEICEHFKEYDVFTPSGHKNISECPIFR